jgi:L-cysteine S-thiosulfotransferase
MTTAANGAARSAIAALLVFGFFIVQASTGEIPRAERRSGYEFMTREVQAMQDDRTANPGTLWVLDGEALWKQRAGTASRSCADCHRDAGKSMKGVAARYPAFDKTSKRPINLEHRINLCRTNHQRAAPFDHESKDLLTITAYVAAQSSGQKIAPPADRRLDLFRNAGRELFLQRQGQLNLSCAQCHDDNWGKKLSGAVIPQAHPTGYPLYRLEWQSLGSLQRRLRNCLIGMRAEHFEYGSPSFVSLELYLMWRARGMRMDAPAVRP